MITDLFSHKIHSSGEEWPDKLVELASLFREFDGQQYDREAIEKRLQSISTRSAYAPRDPAKFRDEITAYPAYLGLFHYYLSGGQWTIRLSRTAKALLCSEEPDVAAFLRIQLALFQYPNGMGVVYTPGTDRLHLQANSREKTLELISIGCHLSPLRLITNALLADSLLRGCGRFNASITCEEIYALANHPTIIKLSSPQLDILKDALRLCRAGGLEAPPRYERRLHLLKHTDLFDVLPNRVTFRSPANKRDEDDLEQKITAILEVTSTFTSFDNSVNAADLEAIVAAGAWSEYFDGLVTLPTRTYKILARDAVLSSDAIPPDQIPPDRAKGPKDPLVPDPLVARKQQAEPIPYQSKEKEFADPEVTRIKRQRQSLKHKALVDAVDDKLRELDAEPKQSAHIDLYAEIPADGAFLFEMKSGGESLHDQVRKGFAQLHEYRFRYRDTIRPDARLCLVLGHSPDEIPWVVDYLWDDQKVAVCWFDEDNHIVYPQRCSEALNPLGFQVAEE